jgi:NitT/TauT family transport system permease protein
MAEQVNQFIRSNSKDDKRQSPTVIYRPAGRFRLLPLAVALVVLAVWHILTSGESGISFVIAPPLAVARQFVVLVLNGTLFRHISITFSEIALGFSVGVSLAFILGYAITQSWLLERTLSPYVVGFQAVPLVVIAPVLIVMFGPGILTNAGICALIVFFPMLVSTIVGMRSVDPDLRDLMRSLKATRWQMFTRLELPSALPALFGGLKIGTTLAVAGAVVGEAISANAGLGFLIYASRYVYDKSSVWVGIFTLTALALVLYEMIARIERRFLAWQRRGR